MCIRSHIDVYRWGSNLQVRAKDVFEDCRLSLEVGADPICIIVFTESYRSEPSIHILSAAARNDDPSRLRNTD